MKKFEYIGVTHGGHLPEDARMKIKEFLSGCNDMLVEIIIKVHHNERVPADLLLLYTTEKSGSVFIRTDQLDGETDWKLRKAVGIT